MSFLNAHVTTPQRRFQTAEYDRGNASNNIPIFSQSAVPIDVQHFSDRLATICYNVPISGNTRPVTRTLARLDDARDLCSTPIRAVST